MNLNPSFLADELVKEFPEPESVPGEIVRVIIQGSGACLRQGDPPLLLHAFNPSTGSVRVILRSYLGSFRGRPCYAEEIHPDNPLPAGWELVPIRELPVYLPRSCAGIGAFAAQTLNFVRNSRFCGRCGAGTESSPAERAAVCPSCGLVTYPRISPAVLVLVQREERILLVRSPRFPPGVYSLVAGFVEPGETLEHAALREVREETGIQIQNLSYLASEPWPFPDSLMIAFSADYAGGDIRVDGDEIESAGWFTRDTMPLPPSPFSLSRALIEQWSSGWPDP